MVGKIYVGILDDSIHRTNETLTDGVKGVSDQGGETGVRFSDEQTE